jgi:predicted TIM-barrel fold metal-dependent hydrolase
MIIDAHCHAGKGDLMTAPWNTDAPLAAYLRRARAAGIDRTIVMPAFHTDNWHANREVARLIARHPSRFIGFAFVHAKRDAGRVFRMLRHAVTHWGFRGIKVHGYEAMPTREVCDTARTLALPILVDVTSRAEVVDMFAPQYPAVNFIIAHLGSYTDNWKAHEQVIHQLARYPNVYADTSGVRQFDYLVRAVQVAGARKLLFGSDGPWLHPELELHKIRLLGLKPHEEALILGGNILRLLRNAGHRSHLKYRRGTAATYDYREITADTIHGEFHSEPADVETEYRL